MLSKQTLDEVNNGDFLILEAKCLVNKLQLLTYSITFLRKIFNIKPKLGYKFCFKRTGSRDLEFKCFDKNGYF